MIRRLAILVSLAVFPVALAQANLITDGGFESCGANGSAPPNWSDSNSNGAFCEDNAHSGTHDADFSDPGGTLSQSLSTIVGDQYDFQFWFKAPAATGTFSASFGSNQVFSTSSGSSLYTKEDFTVTATSTTTNISFTGAANGDDWSLDDVSVTDLTPAAAPEPSTFLLASAALGALFIGFRRKGESR